MSAEYKCGLIIKLENGLKMENNISSNMKNSIA